MTQEQADRLAHAQAFPSSWVINLTIISWSIVFLLRHFLACERENSTTLQMVKTHA